MDDLRKFECFGCYDENKLRPDGRYCTHSDPVTLDNRIWRGSVIYPDRRINGHLSWNEVLASKIGIEGEVKVLGIWNNPPRNVYCLGSYHYQDKDAKLKHPLAIRLKRVPYRGDVSDRAVSAYLVVKSRPCNNAIP